eukprot:5057364-Pyramimonas_sp.AAC.1
MGSPEGQILAETFGGWQFANLRNASRPLSVPTPPGQGTGSWLSLPPPVLVQLPSLAHIVHQS